VPEALLMTIAHDRHHLELLRELGLTAYMVPLRARGWTFGAMTFAMAHACRRYNPADLVLVEDLSHRAALALDNARLYHEAQEGIAGRQRAEEALRQARDELEWRVRERTAALVQANESLRREITERQQVEEQVRQQQEALAQRDKLAAMGSLLAGVAHELNNHLAVVMMRADVLHEELHDGPLAEQVHAITQAAERCVRIVNNFLTLARQHSAARQPVQLNTVIEEALQLLAYMLQVDDIAVELHLAPDLPTLWADPHQLHQVVLNPVTNAHQALREVPTPRRLTLTTHGNPTGTFVRLEVADTGPGIPPAVQARIFEPFFTTKPLVQHHREKCPFSCLLRELRTSRTMDTN
jgi:C4-dicarboxylate-specific signal transduction histidine kinase